jgi:hypothetical protein
MRGVATAATYASTFTVSFFDCIPVSRSKPVMQLTGTASMPPAIEGVIAPSQHDGSALF